MLHKPDGVTPIAETVEALGELVQEGKARYAGLSNVDVDQIDEAAAAAKEHGVPLVCVESRYSLIRRGAEADVVPACERHGFGLLPYYPLESGLLTGKYHRGEAPPADSRFVGNATVWPAERWLTDEAFDAVEALEAFAGERRRAAARPRARRPRGHARRRQRHRGCDDAGPGAGERPRRAVAARPPTTSSALGTLPSL